MTIETKYNIGDEVWYLFNNHVGMIAKIVLICVGIDMKVRYRCDNSHNYFFENDLFPTKEELLKSL